MYIFTVYQNLVEVGFEPNSNKTIYMPKKVQLVVKKIFNVSMKEEERLGGNGTFPFRIFEFVIYIYIYIGCTYY
jgi:hypothetical protein